MDNIRRRIVGVMFTPSDLRRSMRRLSKIDESTFGDGCVDLRRPMIDVSTFEDR